MGVSTIASCAGIIVFGATLLVAGIRLLPQASKQKFAIPLMVVGGVVILAGIGFGVHVYRSRTTPRPVPVAQVPAKPPVQPEGKQNVAQVPKPEAKPKAGVHKKPKQTKTVSTKGTNGGAVGSLTQGPGSIAQIGGSNNSATVVNSEPSLPEVRWRIEDKSPMKGAKHPEVWVRISINRLFFEPKFAVTCDRPCKAVQADVMSGESMRPGLQQVGRATLPDRPDIAVFVVNSPDPMPAEAELSACVESEDQKPVKILAVSWLKTGKPF